MKQAHPRFLPCVRACALAALVAHGGFALTAEEAKAETKAAAPETKAPAAEAKPAAPVVPVVPPPPVPPTVPTWGEELIGIPVRGTLTSRLRVRWTEYDHDTDLYETLSVSVGDAERNAVTAFVLARAAADLDGKTDSEGYYVFDSLEDTYDSAVTAQLYEAYLDIHRQGPLELARLGRQSYLEAPVVVAYDGGRAESTELTDLALRAGVYGGVPVHDYESSPEGDWIVGAYAQSRPWHGGRVRFDWMHVDDENYFGANSNDLLGVSAWQDLFDRVQLYGQYTRLEERSRDVTARATWREPEWDLVVQGMFYELLQTQRDYALEFDPYYNTALEYKPYCQARGLVSKGFGEHVTVDGGVEARWLRDAADEGDFNHEFQRYFLTPAVQDLLLKGLSIGLTGEYWNSDDDIWTWGADVTQKVGKDLRVSAGTVFSLYKYDYYAAEERDDVRTLYLRARYKLGSGLRLDGGYENEHSSQDTVNTVRLGLTWDF